MIRVTYHVPAKDTVGVFMKQDEWPSAGDWALAENAVSIWETGGRVLATYAPANVVKVERLEPGKCETCGK